MGGRNKCKDTKIFRLFNVDVGTCNINYSRSQEWNSTLRKAKPQHDQTPLSILMSCPIFSQGFQNGNLAQKLFLIWNFSKLSRWMSAWRVGDSMKRRRRRKWEEKYFNNVKSSKHVHICLCTASKLFFNRENSFGCVLPNRKNKINDRVASHESRRWEKRKKKNNSSHYIFIWLVEFSRPAASSTTTAASPDLLFFVCEEVSWHFGKICSVVIKKWKNCEKNLSRKREIWIGLHQFSTKFSGSVTEETV